LELGGGSSTPWLLQRSKAVVTIETDPAYAQSIMYSCSAYKNLTLLVSELNLDLIRKIDKEFDLVIVDFNENDDLSRESVLPMITEKFPAAIICLDNSDRYVNAPYLLKDYRSKVVVGLVRKPFCANQTTFFYPK